MLEAHVVTTGTDRPTIPLAVRTLTDDPAKRETVARWTAQACAPGILYTASREDAETYAGRLRQDGVDAEAYHAGMKAADRRRIHDGFMAGAPAVVVATSAFGTGIDKADVLFVAHASVPESVRHAEWGAGTVMRTEEDRLVVLLEQVGYKTLSLTAVQEGDLLTGI